MIDLGKNQNRPPHTTTTVRPTKPARSASLTDRLNKFVFCSVSSKFWRHPPACIWELLKHRSILGAVPPIDRHRVHAFQCRLFRQRSVRCQIPYAALRRGLHEEKVAPLPGYVSNYVLRAAAGVPARAGGISRTVSRPVGSISLAVTLRDLHTRVVALPVTNAHPDFPYSKWTANLLNGLKSRWRTSL